MDDSKCCCNLFYILRSPHHWILSSGGLLPSYRTNPRMRTIDIPGMKKSLETIMAWNIDRAVACHTDPIESGGEAKALMRRAWAWVLE